jgi:protein-disulfide isomerase
MHSYVRFASARVAMIAALVAFALPVFQVAAQEQAPAAQAPAAPAPAGPPVFPKPDPANFTATSPTKEVINAFLVTSWGFDDSRVWQIQAIQKTPVDGVSKVVIFVGDKTGKQKPSALQFFVLPDGKHIIAGDEVITFGEHPFTDARTELQQRANGPYRGSASKDLELVEFADFQCPHCKDAQANMEKLAVDFPKARIIFQNYPLPQHTAAASAAAFGQCVAKLGGNDAFFTFASAVFEGQDGLATPDGATLTLNSAAAKAGLDTAKVSACATSPETTAAVDASVKLAKDLNIQQTPTLMVNGRMVPIGGASYDILKRIIEYQAKLDGITQ